MKRRFGLMMFVMFFSHALLFTQIVPFLISVGYTSAQRGYLVAAYAAFSMLGQVVFGYLSDKHGSIKRFVVLLTYLTAIAGILNFNYDHVNFMYHFFVLSVTVGSTRIVANLFETWVLEVDELHHDFSYLRSFGSLGWAIASLLSGYLVLKYGYNILGYSSAILGLLLVWLASKATDASKEERESLKMSDLKLLLKNKNYILLIVVYFFVYLIYNTDPLIVTEYMFELGGDAQAVGLRVFVQAMSEIPILYVGARLFRKRSPQKLLRIALLILCVRFILIGLSSHTWMIIALSLLQAITFPIILITQKYLVFAQVPEHLRSSGQMVAVSLSIGLSSVLAPLVSNALITMFSLSTTIIIFGLSLLIPFGLMKLYK
ncbi:MFS transporter [Erysipelothrix urinaevulpis]|uniref:MFS transporter n=1 Tax=Erysipelothrix urinaevulpis TaxID=2683717 RepID=UPI00135A8772|nr:MFS transporter [Erysipelothrix urinaevulpis]